KPIPVMSIEKENFLRTRLIGYLQRLNHDTQPRWGKMNVQQMIEHLTEDGLKLASGRIKVDNILTPPEHLERTREFMMSDKPFKENTRNPLMKDEPPPVRHRTVQAAIGELQE